ncbi:MAG: hypothetical protein M1835_007067 [Candelina submexicana]|nr:MAG: hypothetical protein M1835_007067 [Candelina submexicana]
MSQPTPRASSSPAISDAQQDVEGVPNNNTLVNRILRRVEELHRKTQRTAALLQAAQTANSSNERDLQELIGALKGEQQRARGSPVSIEDPVQPQDNTAASEAASVRSEVSLAQNSYPGEDAENSETNDPSEESSSTINQVTPLGLRKKSQEAYDDDDSDHIPLRVLSVMKRRRGKAQSVSSTGSASSSPRRHRQKKSKSSGNRSGSANVNDPQLATPSDTQDTDDPSGRLSSTKKVRSASSNSRGDLEPGVTTFPSASPKPSQPIHVKRGTTSSGDLRNHPSLQILRDAIALLPHPTPPAAPDEEVVISHYGLKQFLYDTKTTFSKSVIGKLAGGESVEFMKINPYIDEWAPKFGHHGALTVVNNEGSTGEHEIYPVLMKDDEVGWKYGGEYRIGKSISITADLWMSFPIEIRDRLFIVIANSAWGNSWLLERGQKAKTGSTYLRNCLDVPKALSKETDLALTWIIIKFEEYSEDFYKKLARVWDPPRSSSRKGNRQTGGWRRSSSEGPVTRQKAEELPEVSELIDPLHPYYQSQAGSATPEEKYKYFGSAPVSKKFLFSSSQLNLEGSSLEETMGIPIALLAEIGAPKNDVGSEESLDHSKHDFEELLADYHTARKPDDPAFWWCPVLKSYGPKSIRKGTHILPSRFGNEVMQMVFGACEGRYYESDDPSNGLVLDHQIAAAYRHFDIVIMPDEDDEDQWVVRLINDDIANQVVERSSPHITFRGLNGVRVDFESGHQPCPSFLYCHYVLALLRAVRRDRQSNTTSRRIFPVWEDWKALVYGDMVSCFTTYTQEDEDWYPRLAACASPDGGVVAKLWHRVFQELLAENGDDLYAENV